MIKVNVLVKKYSPDILILLGILISSYNFLRPAKYICEYPSCNIFDGYGGYTNYHTNLKVLGLFIITLGIILAIRRYWAFKKLT